MRYNAASAEREKLSKMLGIVRIRLGSQLHGPGRRGRGGGEVRESKHATAW